MNKDTKEYIIDEAYKLFLNKSYDAVSISDISDSISLTKGALYHHFENKLELFSAVIQKFIVITVVEVDFNTITLKEYNKLGVDNAQKLLTTISGNKKKLNPISYMSLISDSFRHIAGFDIKMNNLLSSEVAKTKKVLEIAIKNKEIRKDIDTEVFANIYFSNFLSIAGNIMRNHSIDLAIEGLRIQLNEMYRILKV